MKAFLVFLACLCIVRGQLLSGCPLPDNATLQTIVSQLRGAAIQLTTSPAYKCQATSGTQGAFQYFSAVLRYTRSGVQEAGQFDASCLDGKSWTGISSLPLASPTDPVLGALLKTNCLQCVTPNASNALLQNLDALTHCLPCPSSCKGLAQCYYTSGYAKCCNYINSDGSCVEQCPPSLSPNAAFVCSIVVGFSSSADTIYRSNLPYRFTIFMSTPLSPYLDTILLVTGGTNDVTVPLLENADLIQYETDIEEDEIALEDPRVYTLSLQATSSILPLVSGGLVRATQYFPTLQLTVIDDAVVVIGFASPTTTIDWNIATVTIVSSIPIAKPLVLQLTSATGINQTLVTQPIDSPLDLQFPILLAYSDIIVALTDGSDLSVSLTLVTPNPYVVIGGWSPFSSTQLIGASNEEVTIGFAFTNVIASEGDGSFYVTIECFNATLKQPIAVLLSAEPGPQTNTSGGNYTFDNNTTSIVIAFPIMDDRVALEMDVIYNLTLTLVQPDPRVHLSPAYFTVTIKDNDVVYIAMATERLVVDSETLVLPVCVNRSGAERLAQPLPFTIQVTNIQVNSSIVAGQFDGHFDPLDSSSMVCVNISLTNPRGELEATLVLSTPITGRVALLPGAMATIISVTTLEPVSSNVQPAVTSSVQPLVTSNVQPLVTSNVQPLVTSSVQPLFTSSVQPLVTSNLQPLVTSDVQPLVTSNVQPLVTSNVQPLVTSNVQPLVTSDLQPLVTSDVQPLVTSDVQPLVTSDVQPSVTSSVQPLVTSNVQPLFTSNVQPLVTSNVQPLVTSNVQPLVTSSVQPLVTSNVQPLVTSSVQPLVTSNVQPLVTSDVQPLVTSNVQPLVTSDVQPLVTSDVQPLVTSNVQPLVTSHVQPLVTSNVQPLVTSNVQPLVTSNVQPLVTSSVQPLVTSSVQPLVTSNVQPLVTSSVQPLVTTTVRSQFTTSSAHYTGQLSVHISTSSTLSSTLALQPSMSQLPTSQLYPTSQLVHLYPTGTSQSSQFLSNQPSSSSQLTATPLPSPSPSPQPITSQLVNDTMVADPLFTVPLLLTPKGSDPALLCYEVHGQAGYHYNLVSDTCVSVNAFYVEQGSLNVIGTIGIRAVNDAGRCVEVSVNLTSECMPYVNGQPSLQYSAHGVAVSKFRQKVRVAVPNCKVQSLVMWVTCAAYSTYQTLQFTVTRGLNLSPTSHGLIGQFWSVPVTRQLYQDPAQPAEAEFQRYLLTVYHPDAAAPRSFFAAQYSQTWDRTPTPCYYAGSSQGGLEGPSHDSVIEGRYIDYQVSALESTLFKYSKFNKTMCVT